MSDARQGREPEAGVQSACAWLLLHDRNLGRALSFRVSSVAADIGHLRKARPVVRFNGRGPDEDRQAQAVLRAAAELQPVLARELPDRGRLFGAGLTVPEAPAEVDGRSGELLYALCLFLRASGWTFDPPAPAGRPGGSAVVDAAPLAFAATGAIGDGGRIEPIDGVVPKLTQALAVLPRSALLLYPQANQGEIGRGLALRAARRGIDLIPVDSLDQALAALLPQAYQGWWQEPPYVGLRPFDVSDSRIFLGRRDDSRALIERLRRREQGTRPGALILAESGAGKSSFARAGVLAQLRRGLDARVLQYAVWQPRDVLPRDDLQIADVARSLFAALVGPDPRLPNRGFLRLDPHARISGFDDLLGQLAPLPDGRAGPPELRVLLVDQFEELFGLPAYQPAHRLAVARFLRQSQRCGIWVLATLRRDAYASMAALRDDAGHALLLDVFRRHDDIEGEFALGPVDRAALLDLITGPAALARLEFEERGSDKGWLPGLIADDLSRIADGLPLLSFTLQRLYEACRAAEAGEDARLLTFQAYRSIGGVRHSLSQAAQQCQDAFERELGVDRARTALAVILDALSVVVEPGDRELEGGTYLAATVPRELLVAADPAAADLIDALIGSGVIVSDADGIRVAHEVLFSAWATARELLRESFAARVVARRLASRRASYPDEPLMTGSEIAQARDLVERSPHVLARHADLERFLRDSIEQYERAREAERLADELGRRKEAAQRRKDKRNLRLLTGAMVLVLCLLAVAIQSLQRADAESRTAIARRLVLQSQAARLGHDRIPLDQTMADLLFAGALVDADPEVDAEAAALINEHPALEKVVSMTLSPVDGMPLGWGGNAGLWYLAGGRLVAVLAGNQIQVVDAASGQGWTTVRLLPDDATGSVDPADPGRRAAAVSRSGDLFARGFGPAEIRLHDLSRRVTRRLALDGERPAALAFSADDRWLGAVTGSGATLFWDLAATDDGGAARPARHHRAWPISAPWRGARFPEAVSAAPAPALQLSAAGTFAAVRIGEHYRVLRREDGVMIPDREPGPELAGRAGLQFGFIDDSDRLRYAESARTRMEGVSDETRADCDPPVPAAMASAVATVEAVAAGGAPVELVRGPGCQLAVFDHELQQVVARVATTSAEGPIAIAGSGDLAAYATAGGEAQLWRWRAPGDATPFDASAAFTLATHQGRLVALALQPGDRQLASLDDDGLLQLSAIPAPVPDGRLALAARPAPVPQATVERCLRDLPGTGPDSDGLLAVAGPLYVIGQRERAFLWNVEACVELAALAASWHVPVSSNGRFAAVPLRDGGIRIVESDTGAPVLALPVGEASMDRLVFGANDDASAVVISPDATRIRLWRRSDPPGADWDTARAGRILQAAISGTGQFVATLHRDSVGLYSVDRAGEPVTSFRHRQPIDRIARVAVDDSGAIRLELTSGEVARYPPPAAWRSVLCRQLPDELTATAWRQRVSAHLRFSEPCPGPARRSR